MLNNKQLFSKVSMNISLPQTFLFYSINLSRHMGLVLEFLWWLFHEISEEPILLKSIFGGLNLLEIWPKENGTLLYQNSHITSSPLQKTLQNSHFLLLITWVCSINYSLKYFYSFLPNYCFFADTNYSSQKKIGGQVLSDSVCVWEGGVCFSIYSTLLFFKASFAQINWTMGYFFTSF